MMLWRADASDVYPMGMMGFLVWDINSTDIGESILTDPC